MHPIYELHKTLLNQNLILVYEGEFMQDVTKSVLSMAEKNMDSYDENPKVKRKVFNVMMECLQNIAKHADNIEDRNNDENNAVFLIGKNAEGYEIISGNAVYKNNVAGIQEKLERINELDKDGLKQLYKEQILSKGGLSEKGGAGLGFIDMARKSGNKLSYHFEPINDELSFFSLKAMITR